MLSDLVFVWPSEMETIGECISMILHPSRSGAGSFIREETAGNCQRRMTV